MGTTLWQEMVTTNQHTARVETLEPIRIKALHLHLRCAIQNVYKGKLQSPRVM